VSDDSWWKEAPLASADAAPPDDAPSAAPAAPALDPMHRDLLIRTVLGEAGAEPDDGQSAVAAVIKNRVGSGRFGGDIPGVILAKNQFEPWSTREGRATMMAHKPDSPAYQRAAANVDRVFGDEGFDPTGGATYFFAPKLQADQGRAMPSFAKGEPTVIGRHNFYGGTPPVTDVSAQSKPVAGADDWWKNAPVADDIWWKSAPLAEATAANNPRVAREGLSEKAPEPGLLSSPVLSPVTDVPREAYRATVDAIGATGHYLNPFSEERQAAASRGDVWSPLIDTGKGIASALSIPAAPFIGAARSLIGHPMSVLIPTRTPEEQKKLRDAGVSEDLIPGATREENYEKAKGHVDTAMMAMAPKAGTPRGPVPAAVPPPPSANGPLGVTLSEGQATGALPLIQKEQAALRGALGDSAQARAKEFADQQRGEVQTATESVTKQLDPFKQVVAESPQEAGQLVSEGIQSAAAQRKAGVKQAYDEAKSLPGEIHAGAFEGIGPKIKAELSLRGDPVVIDDKLTPFASRAIQDVEERIANLRIQNRADPFGEPNPETISGVSLRGVDQMRRRLSAFRSDAFASGNAADGRAAKAVLDAFDAHVDKAINGGLFKGDPRAVQAWNDARAAHADYKNTFAAGKNDPVGRVVERILGKGKNEAAIPNDVADFVYGSSGVNPSSLNVGVAKRVKAVLGEQSPEWSAVKQGLFNRLIDAGPGAKDWGPGKIAQRINKFMNSDGVELSKEIFSPPERKLIQQFADLHRKLEIPQAGANWSNTAATLAPMLKKMSGAIASLVGAVVGHTVAPGLYGAGEGVGMMAANRVSKAVSEAKQVRQISKQMPLVGAQLQKWQRAVARAARSNAPISQRAVNVASANLAQSLQNIGLNPLAFASQSQTQQ
jgi:hypothetical protein